MIHYVVRQAGIQRLPEKVRQVSRRLYYLCARPHVYAFGVFAAFYAKELAPSLRILPYRTLYRIRTFPPGVYIFTDFDRLDSAQREQLAQLVDALEGSGMLVLNHPSRALGRFDLLRRLHTEGLNAFNVYRLADWRRARRFPAFIRAESGHERPLTDLLAGPSALGRQAEALMAEREDVSDLMIVEFGNARGADGRFRKYSAYRIGNEIYGQHCFSSGDWWIKFAGSDFKEHGFEEHLKYVADNPHRAQLARIFEVAGIDYGRIDYCVVEGKVQTFEINTNPTVLQIDSWKLIDMSPYARLHEDALGKLLEHAPETPAIMNPLFKGGPEILAGNHGIEVIDSVRTTWPQAAPPGAGAP